MPRHAHRTSCPKLPPWVGKPRTGEIASGPHGLPFTGPGNPNREILKNREITKFLSLAPPRKIGKTTEKIPSFVFRAEKTMTATDVTGFDAIFFTGFFRYFLQILGGSSYQIAHKYWRKSRKSSGEPPVERAPRNCRFLSLVVVERALMYFFGFFSPFCGVGLFPVGGLPRPVKAGGVPKIARKRKIPKSGLERVQ